MTPEERKETEHSLIDEVCRQIADTEDRPFDAIDMDNMRAGADWQLEQVIAFLRKNLDEGYIDDGDRLAPGIDAESVIDDLKQAMRPTTTTTTQENS